MRAAHVYLDNLFQFCHTVRRCCGNAVCFAVYEWSCEHAHITCHVKFTVQHYRHRLMYQPFHVRVCLILKLFFESP